MPTGFLGGAKTDIRSTRTPKKPGFCEKPGFCWGKKHEGVAQAACNIAQKMAKVLAEITGFHRIPKKPSDRANYKTLFF